MTWLLDYFQHWAIFNNGNLTKSLQFSKRWFKNFHVLIQALKNCPKTCRFLPKWQKFAKSVTLTKRHAQIYYERFVMLVSIMTKWACYSVWNGMSLQVTVSKVIKEVSGFFFVLVRLMWAAEMAYWSECILSISTIHVRILLKSTYCCLCCWCCFEKAKMYQMRGWGWQIF